MVVRALMLALALSGVGPVRAQEPPTLTVGVEALYYYPHYALIEGEFLGFAREVLDAFAEANGYRLVYEAYPIDRLYHAFLDGKVDLKYPDHPNWRRELKAGHAVRYSAPIVAFTDGVSVRPAMLDRPVEDLKTLATVRGFTAWDYLDRIAAGTLALQETNSFIALIKMVQLDRVDGAYANVDVVRHQLRHVLRAPGSVVFDARQPHTSSYYHLSTVNHPDVVDKVGPWVDAQRSLMARLADKYEVSLDGR